MAWATETLLPAISPKRHPPERRFPKRNAVAVRNSQALKMISRFGRATSLRCKSPKKSCNAASKASERLAQRRRGGCRLNSLANVATGRDTKFVTTTRASKLGDIKWRTMDE